MRSLFKTALACLFASVVSSTAMADAKSDALLAKIDEHINAKRLSTPQNNNAINAIWQFKSLAPFDQRINTRVYKVGEIYVDLAKSAMSKKKYSQAQSHLDNAWSIAYLTPGLDTAQDTLDVALGGKAPASKAKPVKQVASVAKPAPVVKKDNTQAQAKKAQAKAKAAKAKKEKQLAAARLAKQKADKQLAERRRATQEKERQLAQLRQQEQNKREQGIRLAALKIEKDKASAAAKVIKSTKEESKPIARFSLDQQLINNRETRNIRGDLIPVCQEIIDNQASVVLHTLSTQDYRWLMVRLTLCVRRIDKSFRLRHSHKQINDQVPSISLHPGRNTSLLKQIRG